MKPVLLLLFMMNVLMVNAQDTVKAVAPINEATVYFGYGAELTHSTKVNVSRTTRYIVIDNLATQIDQNSLQIRCPENISLLSQQFSLYTPEPKAVPTNPLTQKISDSINRVNKEIAVIMNKIDIDETVLGETKKLIESTIATSGSKTELNGEVLKLVNYYNEKIEKNKKAIFNNRQEVLVLQEKMRLMNDRYSVSMTAPPTPAKDILKPYGRIIMQVVCRADMPADIALSYYTNNAGWQPLYDIRVNSKSNELRLVYKAAVTQNTGIDWKKTKLTLSTGTPNFTTTAPLLNPFYLQLYVPQLYQTMDKGTAELSAVVVNKMQSLNGKVSGLSDYSMDAVTPSTMDQYTKLKQGLLNTNFEIELPYDIESNGLAHSINIKEGSLQSRLKNYAVPKLDGDAYLLAEVADWESLDLIPGNANIIMDDTYIGRSFIDPNTTTDTLNLSLGKDRRIAVKRSAVKDATTSKVKDAFIKQTFTWELTVKNNKTTETDLLLKDQYPLSNVKEVETELLESMGAAVNTETGVLTWKVNLKPGESKKFRFSYAVKYPKDKKIVNLR